jgi:transcriptional regulator with XRE-family HTH domain
MDYYALIDDDIANELGNRLRLLRERRGYSKQILADAVGQPASVITALEKGRGSLALLIAALRQLGALDQLERFLLESPLRALELKDTRMPTAGTVMSRRSPHSSSMAGGIG